MAVNTNDRNNGTGRRPANGQPGTRPAGARPAGANGTRPAGTRPAGANGQSGTRPAGARPAGANGARPAGTRPANSNTQRQGSTAARSGAENRSAGARPAGPGSNQRPAAQMRQKKKKGKIILFTIEILVIFIMLVVAWMVFRTTDSEGPKVTVLEADPDKLEIPTQIQESKVMKGYMNIALFGVDATTESQLYRGSRSDSMMIASVNLDTGDIRLVSVYRDTFLNIDDTNSYQKGNHSYSIGKIDGDELKGGPTPAMKMLNKNLDLNITDFITVGYRGLSEVIDGLGGVYLDVDSTEIQHINNYQIGISESLKCSYKPVTETGYQLLDGIQASAYCRIRYGGGDDFKRASRQREVIKAIEARAKEADLNTLTKVFNNASKHIFTSLDSKDILDMIGNIKNYRIVEEDGFPQENMRTIRNMGAKGSCVIPLDLESNVVWLHQFLFEEQDYQVTDKVKEYSRKIAEEAGRYANSSSSDN